MNRENELFSAIRRTGRVIPTFATLSIVGCAVAHFVFGVSAQYLGVVVAVPLTGIFLISRVLRIVVTPTTEFPSERRAVPKLFVLLGLIAFLAGLLAIDLLMSAGVFAYLALPGRIVSGTLTGAAISGVAALASIMAAALLIMRKVMARFSVALKAGIWHILSCPARLADLLPTHLRKT